jgi:hypothetical protein
MKTSELTGAALDWAVAKCEGWDEFDVHSNGAFELERSDTGDCLWLNCFEPSTDWSQGGPIIEREGIDICTDTYGGWVATLITDWEEGTFVQSEGDTCLIAAMRCYVASKLGDEVEIPEELT